MKRGWTSHIVTRLCDYTFLLQKIVRLNYILQSQTSANIKHVLFKGCRTFARRCTIWRNTH